MVDNFNYHPLHFNLSITFAASADAIFPLPIKALRVTRHTPESARRELGRSHLRFYRAAMEGVTVAKAWQTYLPLEDEFSEAAASALLGWVRQTLIAEALAAGRPDLIGLFRRSPQRIRASDRPSLEEFSQRYADAAEFSEAELLALWQEQHGQPDNVQARRSRLARRLREALDLLELGSRRQPAAHDAVGRWLAPHLAQRLVEAGLLSLADLAGALARRRSPRWQEVPGIGAVGAERLANWLAEQSITAPVAGAATVPSAAATLTLARRPALLSDVGAGLAGVDASADPGADPGAEDRQTETAWLLVPLERFQSLGRPPHHGPQASGLATAELLPARAPSPALADNNLLGARDDKHAIELWLQARASNAHTLRAYRKNAERLLLWCCLERRLGLREMTVADCIHYRQWLLTLGRQTPETWAAAGWRIPAEAWIGSQRAARRSSSDWRPFDGPLASDSVAQDLLVVKALFGFLLKAGYLAHQPWDLLGKTARAATRLADASEQFVERSLDEAQWEWLVQGLMPMTNAVANTPANANAGVIADDRSARLGAILWLGYACGLRAAEMLSLTLGSLQARSAGWRLRVLGKGGKARTVPLPTPARDAVLNYLASVGMGADEVLRVSNLGAASAEAQQPLLRAQRGRRCAGRPAPSSPLSYTTLYSSLKTYLAGRARDLGQRDPVAAAKFRQASTHWLRHTCATLALRSGVPINAVQRVLGHASLQTTSHYLTEQQEALQTAMEGFAAGSRGAA